MSESDLPADALDVASTAVAALAAAHVSAALLPLIATLPPVARLLYDQAVSRLTRFVGKVDARSDEPFDELVARCDTPEKAQLLLQTIEAVREAGGEGQLYLLAEAFVEGATAESIDDVGFETLMARVIGSIEESSLKVLVKFMRSPSEIGLAKPDRSPTVPGFEENPTTTLNFRQLQIVLGVTDEMIYALMATLEGQGLVRRLEAGGNGYGGGVVMPHWMITPFGWELGRRIELVADAFGLG